MSANKVDQLQIGEIYGWYVYLLVEDGDGGFCKVGSASRVDYRLSGLQGGNPRRLSVFRSWHLDNRGEAREVEKRALSYLKAVRLPKSEWVKCSPESASIAIDNAISAASATLRTSTEPRWIWK